jgi:hypothetical protein
VNDKVITTAPEVESLQHELDKISRYAAVLIDELTNSLIFSGGRPLSEIRSDQSGITHEQIFLPQFSILAWLWHEGSRYNQISIVFVVSFE